MGCTSRWCVSVWKTDIYQYRYSKVIDEIYEITCLFYGDKDEEWIEAFQKIAKELKEVSNRRIMPHIKKYLTEFLKVCIDGIKGKCRKSELRKERDRTLYLLRIAYSS